MPASYIIMLAYLTHAQRPPSFWSSFSRNFHDLKIPNQLGQLQKNTHMNQLFLLQVSDIVSIESVIEDYHVYKTVWRWLFLLENETNHYAI